MISNQIEYEQSVKALAKLQGAIDRLEVTPDRLPIQQAELDGLLSLKADIMEEMEEWENGMKKRQGR